MSETKVSVNMGHKIRVTLDDLARWNPDKAWLIQLMKKYRALCLARGETPTIEGFEQFVETEIT